MTEDNSNAKRDSVSRFFNRAAGLSKRALGLVFNPTSRAGMGAAAGITSFIRLSAQFPPRECREDFWLAAGATVLFSFAAAAIVRGGLQAIEHGLYIYSRANNNRLSDWLNGEPPFGKGAANRRDDFAKFIGELPTNFIP